MIRYEVQHWSSRLSQSQSVEFYSRTSAMLAARALLDAGDCEQVSVITWAVEPNLPGLKPDLVYRSAGLHTLRQDGQWYAHYIHGPGPESVWLDPEWNALDPLPVVV